MKYCDKRAKEIREQIDKRSQKYNMRNRGDYVVCHNNFIVLKLVNEVVRTIDTNKSEK